MIEKRNIVENKRTPEEELKDDSKWVKEAANIFNGNTVEDKFIKNNHSESDKNSKKEKSDADKSVSS